MTCWPGRQALEYLCVNRSLPDPCNEILGHGEIYVGLEQRHADLSKRLAEVFFGEAALVAEPAENALKAV